MSCGGRDLLFAKLVDCENPAALLSETPDYHVEKTCDGGNPAGSLHSYLPQHGHSGRVGRSPPRHQHCSRPCQPSHRCDKRACTWNLSGLPQTVVCAEAVPGCLIHLELWRKLLSLSLSLLPLSLSLSLSLSLFSLSLSLPISPSLSMYPKTAWHYLTICLAASASLSLSVSIYIISKEDRNISIPVSMCVYMCICLHPRLSNSYYHYMKI